MGSRSFGNLDHDLVRLIARNLFEFREASGLTQREVAAKMGVVEKTISNFETMGDAGKDPRGIDLIFAHKLMKIYKRTLNDLVDPSPRKS